MIDGTLRQVMLSGRELAIDKDPDAPNWVNQRVIKTHGIGVAMTPVNEVTPEGQPRLWIRDLPPTSNSGAPDITQPRIYFGESDSHYVVVRAKQPEFDYPSNSTRASGRPDDVVDRARPASRSTPPCRGSCSRSGSGTSTCSSPTRSRPTASCCSTGRSPSGWA